MKIKTQSKDEILEEYTRFKRTNVTSEHKINEYRRVIKGFLDSNKKPLKDYEESDLVIYLNDMNKRLNIKSMNDNKTLLRNFIIWFFPDFSVRFRNMGALLRHLKTIPTYSPSDMLSKEDFEKLVKGEESTMWKTFWLTLFYGGMRPIETSQLKWTDITFTDDGAYIEVFVKKNKENFTKYLPENVAFYLKKLKESSTSEYVFPSRIKRDGKDVPMERCGIHRRLKKLSMRVLHRKVNPYLLRHSIATILYNEDGTDKDFVARQMGHTRNMEKTYSHLDDDKIKQKLKRLYIKGEELPPEKKVAMEKTIDKMKGVIHNQSKIIELLAMQKLKKISDADFEKGIVEQNRLFKINMDNLLN